MSAPAEAATGSISSSASMRFWRLRAVLAEVAGRWRRSNRHQSGPNSLTFLVPHHNSAAFLAACLDAIRRFHPDSRIIVTDCASLREQYLAARQACARYRAELQTGWLRHGHTGQLDRLLGQVATGAGVFLDQDCIILKPLSPLIDLLGEGKLLVGPRDYMTLSHPRLLRQFPDLKDQPIRFGRDFIHASLMVTNPAGIRQLVGARPFGWHQQWGGEHIEKYYGLCQRLRLKRPESILALESRHAAYGEGMVYFYRGEALAYHNWYSSAVQTKSGKLELLEVSWLRAEAQRFLDDYWSGKVDFELEPLSTSSPAPTSAG